MNRRYLSPSRIGIACAAVALGGCMNMSGLSGSTSYSCKAPEGVTCDSVSGTYANAIKNNLPSQRPRPVKAGAAASTAVAASGVPVLPSAPPVSLTAAALAMPLRSSARILRLWFKPWEDADRDLYDQGYVYVQIDNGQWLIEHAQRQIREAYAPLRPPPRGPAATGESKDNATAPALSKGDLRLPLPLRPSRGLSPPTGRPDIND